MENDPLDDLLRSYAEAPLEPRYVREDSAVWREIDRRKNQRNWGARLLDAWRVVILEPRLAVAAFAVAVAIGVAPSIVTTRSNPELAYARHSLHLDVFSADSKAFRASMLRPTIRISQ